MKCEYVYNFLLTAAFHFYYCEFSQLSYHRISLSEKNLIKMMFLMIKCLTLQKLHHCIYYKKRFNAAESANLKSFRVSVKMMIVMKKIYII